MKAKKVAILVNLDEENFYANLFAAEALVSELTVYGSVEILTLATEDEISNNKKFFTILKEIGNEFTHFTKSGKKEHKKLMDAARVENIDIYFVGEWDDYKDTLKYYQPKMSIFAIEKRNNTFAEDAWKVKKLKEGFLAKVEKHKEVKEFKYLPQILSGLNIAYESMLKFKD